MTTLEPRAGTAEHVNLHDEPGLPVPKNVAFGNDSSGAYGWLHWRGQSLSPGAVARIVRSVADALGENGIGAGVAVELVMADGAPSVVAFWALIERDASVLLTQAEEWSGDSHRGCHTVIAEGREVTREDLVDLGSLIASLFRQEGARAASSEDEASLPSSGTQWFERTDALGMRTSGTSGTPSVVWKSGTFLEANSAATAVSLGYSSADVMLPLLPLGHQYGASVLVICRVIGASLAICDRRRINEVTRTIQRFGVTAVDAVPRLYEAICDMLDANPSFRDRLRGVRVWGVGGGPLRGTLRDRFSTVTGSYLSDGYGSTEFGNIAVCRSSQDQVWLTPLSCHRVRVVDDTTGKELPPGSGGLLEVLPQVTIRPGDGDGWQSTGDLALQDEKGRIQVLGRAGAINRNGFTVYPAALSQRLEEAGVPGEIVPVEGDPSGAFWLVVHDELKRPPACWRQRVSAVLQEHEMPNHVEVLRWVPMRLDQKVDVGALRRMVSALHQARSRRKSTTHPAFHMATRIEQHTDSLIRLVGEMMGEAVARSDLDAMLRVLRSAPAEMELHRPEGDPPVYVCMPSNALLESLALYALVPALWSRRVVVRPAQGTERVVASVLTLLDDLVGERVKAWVGPQSEFVDDVAAEPAIFVFCGRRDNLEKIQPRLTKRHLIIFFGRGFNPCVVAAGANVEAAAMTTATDRMYAGGQDCLAPNVIFVQHSIWGEFRYHLGRCVEMLAVGHPDWPASTVLPTVRPRSLTEALELLSAHRSHLVSGGVIDVSRLTITPSVLEFVLGREPVPTECFGPVFTLVRFERVAEVLEKLRSDLYLRNALGVTVWGLGEDEMTPLANNYMVGVEQSLFQVSSPYEPFGGSGEEAGYVRYRGRQWTGPCGVSKTVKEHWQDGE